MADLFATVSAAAFVSDTSTSPVDPLLTRVASISALDARAGAHRRGDAGAAIEPAPRVPSSAEPEIPRGPAYVIREGWAFAYTLLANGERQVLGFVLPGDIVGLGGLFRTGVKRGFETITSTVVS